MIKLLENKKVRLLLCVLLVMLIAVVVIQPTYAAGNVSGVIQMLNHKFCDNVNCRLIYTDLSRPFIFNRRLFATC